MYLSSWLLFPKLQRATWGGLLSLSFWTKENTSHFRRQHQQSLSWYSMVAAAHLHSTQKVDYSPGEMCYLPFQGFQDIKERWETYV